MKIKEEIIAFAKSIGLEKVGFARAEEGGTVIVALFPYYVAGESGNLSLYARGRDYHQVAEEKLGRLCGFLERFTPGPFEVQADNGKRNDREAAYQAGLGFYGRNGLLICEEFGSCFFIGQIRTALVLPPDEPQKRTCDNCGSCIRACVGGALSEEGNFDISRCVSEISQRKGKLSAEEEELIRRSGLCWGCDMCQTVCPHNRKLPTTALPEFLERRLTSLHLEDISGLSNREFSRRYQNYAFRWRGKAPLERNLKLLENGYAQE